MRWMKIRPKPKTRAKTSPWQMLQVTPPHGGQEKDSQLDQELLPNPEALGLGQQEGQQPEVPINLNMMQGNVPHKMIERLECKRLLERLGSSQDTAQAIVCNHGYDTAKKLSCLKPDGVDILVKTLHSPGGEHDNGTKDPRIRVLHSALHALTSARFVLFHQDHCNQFPMINMITNMNVYNLDLQQAREANHNNHLYHTNRPKCDTSDPE